LLADETAETDAVDGAAAWAKTPATPMLKRVAAEAAPTNFTAAAANHVIPYTSFLFLIDPAIGSGITMRGRC
jgi:hypothetical protein